MKDGQAMNVSPNYEYPVNLGMACPKRLGSVSSFEADDRALTPKMRS